VGDTIVDRDAGRDSNTLLNILALEFLGRCPAIMKDFGEK
jgi:hypothetical protein